MNAGEAGGTGTGTGTGDGGGGGVVDGDGVSGGGVNGRSTDRCDGRGAADGRVRTGSGGGGGVWLPWREAAERALYGTDAEGAGRDAAGPGTGPEGTGPEGTGPEGTGPGTAPESAGTEGFFLREAPAGHFRTSVHASPLFAVAVARLLLHVDEALGRPDALALIDVGAGRGELLTGVLAALPEETAARVRPYAVERAARPAELDERIVWTDRLDGLERLHGPGGAPVRNGAEGGGSGVVGAEGAGGTCEGAHGDGGLVGLLFANEWLDDLPVDVAETDDDGVLRRVLVRTSDGAERLGDPVCGADAEWLERWWPLAPGDRAPGAFEASAPSGPEVSALGACVAPGAPGAHAPEPGLRAEIGRPRDEAWASAVRTLARGLAVAVDYAHVRADRPLFGTLTGYREGREVRPVPDGTCDLTAHVALDACAAAGAASVAARADADHAVAAGAIAARAEPSRAAGAGSTEGRGEERGEERDEGRPQPSVLSQRAALHSLGIDGARPPLALASSDPTAYVRRLASAGEAAELTDPGGLGAFGWLVQPLGGVPSPFGPRSGSPTDPPSGPPTAPPSGPPTDTPADPRTAPSTGQPGGSPGGPPSGPPVAGGARNRVRD